MFWLLVFLFAVYVELVLQFVFFLSYSSFFLPHTSSSLPSRGLDLLHCLKALTTKSAVISSHALWIHRKTWKFFVIDFRNSLPIDDNGNFDPGVLGDLFVAVPRHTNPLPDCSDDLLWLGSINYRTPNRYKNTVEFRVFHHLGRFHYGIWKQSISNPWLLLRYSTNYLYRYM